MPFCSRCGKALPPDARFCASCGTSTSSAGQPAAQAAQSAAEAPGAPKRVTASWYRDGAEQASERQTNLQKIMTWLLLGLGVLSFFLPLVSLNAPLVGKVDWSALNAISGIFQSPSAERPSFQGIVESTGDSDTAESRSVPLSIQQAVLFPFAVALAYFALCIFMAAESLSLSTTLRKPVGIMGVVCSILGLLSILVLSNGFRQEMSSNLEGVSSDSSQFSALGQGLVQSIKIEPGSGLYLLATVMVLLFLVQSMRVLDSLELRASPNSTSTEISTLSVSPAPSIAKHRQGVLPTKTIVGVGSILVAILALILYRSNNYTPSPTQAREHLESSTQTTPIVRNIAAPCDTVRGYVRGIASSGGFQVAKDEPSHMDLMTDSNSRIESTFLSTGPAKCELRLDNYATVDGKEISIYYDSSKNAKAIRKLGEAADSIKEHVEDQYKNQNR